MAAVRELISRVTELIVPVFGEVKESVKSEFPDALIVPPVLVPTKLIALAGKAVAKRESAPNTVDIAEIEEPTFIYTILTLDTDKSLMNKRGNVFPTFRKRIEIRVRNSR